MNIEQFRAVTSESAESAAEAIIEALARGGEPAAAVVQLYELMRTARSVTNAAELVTEALQGAGVTLPANWREAASLEEMLDGAHGIHPALDALDTLIEFAQSTRPASGSRQRQRRRALAAAPHRHGSLARSMPVRPTLRPVLARDKTKSQAKALHYCSLPLRFRLDERHPDLRPGGPGW